ncbi:RDD family protein [Kineococcus sp. LSe6-4]|uniref:RDD family protein n=1 Tax=Kineococcus halophytocola TaxID=3234027 RepID=A0ABV4H5D2_9ACTN
MSTPPGWYPDPSDPRSSDLRWWDGSQWTDHVHAQQPSPEEPSASPYAGSHTPYPSYPPSQYPAPGVKAIATPDGQALGGLGFRLLARLVDWILVTVISALAGWSSVRMLTTQAQSATDALMAGDTQAYVDQLAAASSGSAVRSLTFVVLAVSAVYTILTLRFYGATPGKALFRLRVRDWNRPGHPGWLQCISRWVGCEMIGQIIPLYLLLDFLWPCWDQRKQALHDKLARTVVVKR